MEAYFLILIFFYFYNIDYLRGRLHQIRKIIWSQKNWALFR